MGIINPTIGDAVAFINKGIAMLDAVVKNAGETAQQTRERIAAENDRMQTAQADMERANRIRRRRRWARKKLEELVS